MLDSLAICLICFSIILIQSSCKKEIPSQQDGQKTLTQLTANLSPRAVQVALVSPQEILLIGTGFLLNNEGYILTAKHVVDQADINKKPLGIIVNMPPNQTANPRVFPPPTNSCDVIATDSSHDLALLKIKTTEQISPFNGQTVHSIAYSNNIIGEIYVKDDGLSSNISKGIHIVISGYASNESDLKTLDGTITTELVTTLTKYIVPQLPNNTYNITDFYETNITSFMDLSGNPVFSTSSGEIIGMCISIYNNSEKEKTIIIPSAYIIAWLKSTDIY